MFTAVLGIIQISLVVNVVSNLLTLDENEKNAIDKIDHSRVAAKAISKSIKYLKHKTTYFKQLKKKKPEMKSDFLTQVEQRKE